MEPVLNMEKVSFRYGDAWVVRDLSFQVEAGEILGVMGPNASGKTTLLRLMDGIIRPQKGTVFLNGEDLMRMGRRKIARQIGVVAQENTVLYAFTALEVVLMGRSAHLPRMGFEGRKDREIAIRSLERTGCGQLSERPVNELSGGERQRVLIARALAQEPRVLLLDEPTVYLDLTHQMEFLDLLVRLHHDEGITIVWVSHDLNLASMICQRLILLKTGRIHALGHPEQVLTESNVAQVFDRPVMVDRNPQQGTPRITPLIGVKANQVNTGGS